MKNNKDLNINEINSQVIKRYLGKEDYVVRIRLDEKNLELIVYYNGRKAFEIQGEKLILDEATFFQKADKKFKLPDDECIKKLEGLGFSFTFGSRVKDRSDKFYKDGYRYRIKVKPSTANEKSSSYYCYNLKDIEKHMDTILKAIKKVKSEVVHYFDEETMINYFYIKDDNIDYDKLINLLAIGIENTARKKGLKKIEFNEKITGTKTSYSDLEYDLIDEIMKERIEAYNKGTKGEEENNEKLYQQKLMNIMFNEERKEKLMKVNNCPFVDAFAFEMEYYLYAAERNKGGKKTRSSETSKGRVDNIFIKDNKVIFTEVKYDEGVIDGANGIHKHLIDLINGFAKNKEVAEEIFDYVCDYNEVLGHFEDKKKYIIKDVQRFKEKDTEKEFVIICGYSEGNEKTVYDKIKSIYNISGKDAGVDKNYTITLDNKKVNLKDLKCYELIDILQDRLFNCKVSIYLVNDDYTEFKNIMTELDKSRDI